MLRMLGLVCCVAVLGIAMAQANAPVRPSSQVATVH